MMRINIRIVTLVGIGIKSVGIRGISIYRIGRMRIGIRRIGKTSINCVRENVCSDNFFKYPRYRQCTFLAMLQMYQR